MNEWYLSQDGNQLGPLSSKQVGVMLAAGQIRPDDTLAWKEGMSGWKSLSEAGLEVGETIDVLKRPPIQLATPSALRGQVPAPLQNQRPNVALQPPVPNVTVPNGMNPYAPPVSGMTIRRDFRMAMEYPGIGRLGFFVAHLLLALVAIGILFFSLLRSGPSAAGDATLVVFAGVIIFYVFFGVFISVKRVQNLGMSGWAVLWNLVPFLNLWISWRMAACPPGYHLRRELDTTGKVLTGLWIGLIVTGIVFNIVAAMRTGQA